MDVQGTALFESVLVVSGCAYICPSPNRARPELTSPSFAMAQLFLSLVEPKEVTFDDTYTETLTN
jgi:hypothetical protein